MAQESEEQSRLANLIEGLVSTPDRQVSITGLEGALSSTPRAERITIADPEGVWLDLRDVQAEWNRTALFRRTVDIESFSAEQVTVLRRPVSAGQSRATGQSRAESEGEGGLPVDIIIDAFRLRQIALAEEVAGVEARLSAEGSARISEETISARLKVERLDRPGTFTADLRLDPARDLLAVDVALSEPEGGVIAGLLGLRDQPAVDLTIDGDGPLADWRAEVKMEAAAGRVLAGTLTVARLESGYRLTGDLAAALEELVPAAFAPLLAGDSRLTFTAIRTDNGILEIQPAALRSEGADLDFAGVFAPDLAPLSADVSIRLREGGRTAIPFVPDVSVEALRLEARLDEGSGAPWRAELTAQGLTSPFGEAASLSLVAGGTTSRLADPAARTVTFRIEASAEGVAAADAAIAEAVGPTLHATANGTWSAGQPVAVESLQAALTNATATFSGTATAKVLNGRFGASITDLSRFARFAGRPLGGGTTLQATGSITPATGTFDLALDGSIRDFRIGVGALDALLSGKTDVRGRVARSSERMSIDRLTVANEKVTAEITGSVEGQELDLSATADISQLSLLTPRAEGRAEISARLTSTAEAPRLEAQARGADVVLMGKPLTAATARFSGVVAGPATTGEAALSASLDGVPVEGSARLSTTPAGGRALEALRLTVGESSGSGDLVIGDDGLLTGTISVASPDLTQVAPLFLTEARGAVEAEITLSADEGDQSATFSASATDLAVEAITLGSATIDGTALDIFSAPKIEGDFAVRNLSVGGLTVVSASGTAEREAGRTVFLLEAALADGSATLRAGLEPRAGAVAVSLHAFSFSRGEIDLSLTAPAVVLLEDGVARFEELALSIDRGSATIRGRAGDTLDLNVAFNSLPAAVANNLVPELGAEGTISGTASVTGRRKEPLARFAASWDDASVAASRNAGVGPLFVTAAGTFANGVLDLTSQINGVGALSVNVAGRIGTAADARLDLTVMGSLPLSIANPHLVSREAALEGVLSLDVRVSGTVDAPQFSGRVTSERSGFIDPATGIALREISLIASIIGNRLIVERLTAESGGGRVSASGSVSLEAGVTLDFAIELRQARYIDGMLLATRLDADLTLTGSLAAGLTLGGTVFLDRTEITVPERLPQDSVAVDVRHVNTPADAHATLAKARQLVERSDREADGNATGLVLDLTIAAPKQIFVRGRGLDTELGGDLRLQGPLSALVAEGAFEMRRGRLDIFTQRITFDRGLLTFAGDLDPVLDFAGTTRSKDLTVTVTVNGPASDPEIVFSSIPELPQDEVLAHLLFNRGVAELSAVQIARLATYAAQLSGAAGGPGLLGRLRESTGLDDLDIVADEEGAPALAAGRYISENVYVSVQQGATGESSRVTIDLDITDDVKARGAVSPRGESSVGIFFEHEY
jgi:translocation and assembly module TamB